MKFSSADIYDPNIMSPGNDCVEQGKKLVSRATSVVQWLWLGLLLLLVTTGTAVAQGKEFEYVTPQDIALIWAKRIALLMTISAILLILYTLIFRHRKLMEQRSKWFLFLGICVLPIPALLVSIGVGLEQSKEVTFCRSCHTMDPFINDLNAPGSKTLAEIGRAHV